MNTQNIIKALTLSFCFMFLACSVKSSEPPDGMHTQPANHLDSLLTPISVIEEAFANQDSGISVIPSPGVKSGRSNAILCNKSAHLIVCIMRAANGVV